MRQGKTMALIAAGLLVVGLSACEKKESTADAPGAAEKAGKQIDQAATKAGEQLNKIAGQAGEKMQEAGQKLQNAADDAQKKQ